jgi:hypothetical protein
MLVGPSSIVEGTRASYEVKMRPCYPYKDAVSFTMSPGEWAGPAVVPSPPSGSAKVERAFTVAGTLTLVATATADATGRSLRTSTRRVVSVAPAELAPPSGLAAEYFAGWRTIRLAWVDNSVDEEGFHVQYSYEGSPFVDPTPATVGADVTGYTSVPNPPAGRYEVRVRAFAGERVSGWSNVASATVPSGVAVYQGCFTDSPTRALPVNLGGGHTVESCSRVAYDRGYPYAGLQYYGECFAGFALGFARVADAECNTPCTANPAQACGGAWRNSIYWTGVLPAGGAPPPTEPIRRLAGQ